MKKFSFLILGALPLLAGCSSDEDSMMNPTLDGEAVSFGTYVGMSRALEKSSFQEDDQIAIWATEKEGEATNDYFTANFMDNEILTKTATGWTYENTKFWPMNQDSRINFLAIYPPMTPITQNSKEYDFLFSVNPNVSEQKDFLWSTIMNAHRLDRNGTYQNGTLEEPNTTPLNDVRFNFRHALSKVAFYVTAATYYNGATIKVTDLVVNNLCGEAQYYLYYTLKKGSWSTKSYPRDQSFTVLEKGAVNVEHNYTRQCGEALLMIPQSLYDTSTVTIKYTVSYDNPAKVVEEERTFSLNGVKSWEQDRVYNYTFNLTLDMITFDASVSSWDDSTNNTLTVE
ncbi:MAG: fimbrillin family protein [Muribaculaceae bacterium]|nr:fimbrillin family protein [Muribaculaceae bacterium]